jgi:hypothetical protein
MRNLSARRKTLSGFTHAKRADGRSAALHSLGVMSHYRAALKREFQRLTVGYLAISFADRKKPYGNRAFRELSAS